MTMTEFLQQEGELIHVCGYAAVFDSLSVPLDEHGGMRELIRPGAFDYALRNLRACTTCTLFHMGTSGAIGSIFHGNLRMWCDDYGLAYECGPFAINSKNVWAIRSIMSGKIRDCSWRGIAAAVPETVDGETVQVIHRLDYLAHIAPGNGCSYPATATWCSHEHLDDLPDRLKRLSLYWQANRPAANPARAARAVAPRPQAPLRAEQAAKAHQEAKARRPPHTRTPRRVVA